MKSNGDLLRSIFKRFVLIIVLSFVIFSFLAFYFFVFISGYVKGMADSQNSFLSFYGEAKREPSITDALTSTPSASVSLSPTIKPVKPTQSVKSEKAGFEESSLWTNVNSKRHQYGVGPLKFSDELCMIASARLNDLVKRGDFDGHEGFWRLKDSGSSLSYIFGRHTSVSEFLAMDESSPEKILALWDNSSEHKKLLNGAEFVWGCILSQGTFSVAIVAY